MRGSLVAGLMAVGLMGAVLVAEESGKPAGKAPTTAPATQPVNKKCPVMGEDIDANVTVTYEGKVYGFCCESCIKDFKKDPAKYAKIAK